jgi:radical SAM superfamily enzyme YgiQ (UPF0313 family)
MSTKKTEITFISPYEDITAYGIRILSSLARKNGFSTKIIFIPNQKWESEENLKKLVVSIEQIAKNSTLLGFSFFTCHLAFVSKLTTELKNKLHIPIIWGGKHISALPDDAIGLADMICIGEGDFSLIKLLQALESGEDYRYVEGIYKPGDVDLGKKPLPPLIEDLDSLPYPDYSMDGHYIWDFEMHEMDSAIFEKYAHNRLGSKIPYQSMSSRGCPYNCTYCSTFKSLYPGQKYLRLRTPGNLIEEIADMILRFPFMNAVILSDDNLFAMSDQQIEELASLYKEKVGLPLRCLAHPANITQKKLELLVDAGLENLQVGIQTGSAKTQKIYKRGPSSEKVLEAVRTINIFKNKLLPMYDFIIDNPFEDKDDLLKTLHMITEFPRPYHLSVFSLVFIPGSELYKKAIWDNLPIDTAKTFECRGKSYLNLLFDIFRLPLPKWFMKLLISRPIINVLDKKLSVNFLYSLRKVIGRLRLRSILLPIYRKQ